MLFPGVTLCYCMRVSVCGSGSEISSSYRRSSLVVDDLWRKRLHLLQELSWIWMSLSICFYSYAPRHLERLRYGVRYFVLYVPKGSVTLHQSASRAGTQDSGIEGVKGKAGTFCKVWA